MGKAYCKKISHSTYKKMLLQQRRSIHLSSYTKKWLNNNFFVADLFASKMTSKFNQKHKRLKQKEATKKFAANWFATKITNTFKKNKKILRQKPCVCISKKVVKQQLICRLDHLQQKSLTISKKNITMITI
jgi:23S rRNA G2069 N7-methylase RlmK/C1962 C5-methylase RlmI